MNFIYTVMAAYFGVMLYHHDTLGTVVMWLLFVAVLIFWGMDR